MMTISSLMDIFSFKYERSTPRYRPFRRYRYDIFTGWDPLFATYWKKMTTESTRKSAESLCGKVVIYSIADTCGGIAGSAMGCTLLGNIGSEFGGSQAGRYFSFGILGVALGQEVLALLNESSSKLRKLYLIAAMTSTIALISIISSDEQGEYGAKMGGFIGEEIGGFAGTILGGYFFLKRVSSPTVLYDAKHPWDSYSSSTARFLIVKMVFECVIARPSSPWLRTIVFVPRTFILITLENFAYNSNMLIPLLKKGMRNSAYSKPFLPEMTKMMINTYCGHNSHFFEEEFSKFTLRHIFPSLAKSQIALLQKCNRVIPNLLMDAIKTLAENSPKLASIAINAFYEFGKLLSGSKKLSKAHQDFLAALLNQKGNHLQQKRRLTEIIRKKLSAMTLWEKGVQRGIDSLWSAENTQLLKTTLNELIQQMEVVLVGRRLTDQRQTEYLNELLDVYFPHYLIFLLSQYDKLDPLSPQKEQESLFILTNIIFNHYINAILPNSIATLGHSLVTEALHTAFKVKHLLFILSRQPDEASYIHTPQNTPLIENYREPPQESNTKLIAEYEFAEYDPTQETQESDFVMVDSPEVTPLSSEAED